MEDNLHNYDLYFKFIEAYSLTGFEGIDRNDRIIEKLELLTDSNDQFFFVADLIRMKILFCSKRSTKMIGIEPEILSPYHINRATHPDELWRMGLGIVNRMKAANRYASAETGRSLLSTNVRMKNTAGSYSNLFFQCFTFYSAEPNNTVYQLQVHTNIDWYDKFHGHYHYYMGEDISKFRYPDSELLGIVSPYSDREFEILKLLGVGLSSEQIAQKLFLSIHTVNTHRRNILKRTGHARIQELLAEMKATGML